MLQSLVWKYFIKCSGIEAQCSICLKKVKTGGGTTNMRRHLRNRHPKYLSEEKSSGTAAGGEDKKEVHIPLKPTIEIKREPIDYYPTPSNTTDTTNEEFILPHEKNTWTPPVQPPPNPAVDPQFTLSVASLASHNNPETSTSDNEQQVGKKRKIKASTFVVEPQFTFSVASLSSPNVPAASGDEQLKKKWKTNPSTITTLVPSTNPSDVTLQSPARSIGESSCPSSSKEPHKDQLDAFGDYIIAKLRSLDWRSSTFAQKAIVDIIFEAEMGKYLKEDCEYKVLKYCAC